MNRPESKTAFVKARSFENSILNMINDVPEDIARPGTASEFASLVNEEKWLSKYLPRGKHVTAAEIEIARAEMLPKIQAAQRIAIRTAYAKSNLAFIDGAFNLETIGSEAVGNAQLFENVRQEFKRFRRMNLRQMNFTAFSTEQIRNYKLDVRLSKVENMKLEGMADDVFNLISDIKSLNAGFTFHGVYSGQGRLVGLNIGNSQGIGKRRYLHLVDDSINAVQGQFYSANDTALGFSYGVVKRTKGKVHPERADIAALKSLRDVLIGYTKKGLSQEALNRERGRLAFDALDRIREQAFEYDPDGLLMARNIGVGVVDPTMSNAERKSFHEQLSREVAVQNASIGISPTSEIEKMRVGMPSYRKPLEAMRIGGIDISSKSYQVYKYGFTAASIENVRRNGIKIKSVNQIISPEFSKFGTEAINVPIFYAGGKDGADNLREAFKARGFGTTFASEDELIINPSMKGLKTGRKGSYKILLDEAPQNAKIRQMIETLTEVYGEEKVRGMMQRGNLRVLISEYRKNVDAKFGRLEYREFVGVNADNIREHILAGESIGGYDMIDNITFKTDRNGAAIVGHIEKTTISGLLPGTKLEGTAKLAVGASPKGLGKVVKASFNSAGKMVTIEANELELIAALASTATKLNMGADERKGFMAIAKRNEFYKLTPEQQETFLREVETHRGIGGVTTYDLYKKASGAKQVAINEVLIDNVDEHIHQLRNSASKGGAAPAKALEAADFLERETRAIKNEILKGGTLDKSKSAEWIREKYDDVLKKYQQSYGEYMTGFLESFMDNKVLGAALPAHAGVAMSTFVAGNTPRLMGAGTSGSFNFQVFSSLLEQFGHDSPLVQEVLHRTERSGRLLKDARQISLGLSGKSERAVSLQQIRAAGYEIKNLFNPDFAQKQAIFRDILNKSGIKTNPNEILSLAIKVPESKQFITIPSMAEGFSKIADGNVFTDDYNSALRSILSRVDNIENETPEVRKEMLNSIMKDYNQRTSEALTTAGRNSLGGKVRGSRQLQAHATTGYSKVDADTFRDYNRMMATADKAKLSSIVSDTDIAKYFGEFEHFISQSMFGEGKKLTYQELGAVMRVSGYSIGVSSGMMTKLLGSSPSKIGKNARGSLYAGLGTRYPQSGLGNVFSAFFYKHRDWIAYLESKNIIQKGTSIHEEGLLRGGLIPSSAFLDQDGDQLHLLLAHEQISISQLWDNVLNPDSNVSRIMEVAASSRIKGSGGAPSYEQIIADRIGTGKPIYLENGHYTPEALNALAQHRQALARLEKGSIGGISNAMSQAQWLIKAHSMRELSATQSIEAHQLSAFISEKVLKGRHGQDFVRKAEELVSIMQNPNEKIWQNGAPQVRALFEDILAQGAKVSSLNAEDLDSFRNVMGGFESFVQAMSMRSASSEALGVYNLLSGNMRYRENAADAYLRMFVSGRRAEEGLFPEMSSSAEQMMAIAKRQLKNIKTPLLIGLGAAAILGMGMGNRSSGDAINAESMLRPSQLPQGAATNPKHMPVPMQNAMSQNSRYRVHIRGRAEMNYDYGYINNLVGSAIPGANMNSRVMDSRTMLRHQDVKERMGY